MDLSISHPSVTMLAIAPLVAWIGAFAMLYAAQRTYPTPRPSVRASRNSSLLLKLASFIACLGWFALLLALK